MSNTFYTHRLTKLIEEFVLGAGMTVHISDESSTVKLKDHVTAMKTVAEASGANFSHRTDDGVTIARLARK
jgi:hypothetical protein